MKKWLAVSAFILSSPILFILGYDLVEVCPRLSIIHNILQTANPQDRNPPLTIKKLIDASFQNDDGNRDAYVTRLVVEKVYTRPSSQKTWHFRNMMWYLLLPLYFNQNERYAIYSTLSPNGLGMDKGLNNFAKRNFNKNLDQLNQIESAMTVANTFAPSRFRMKPDLLKQRAERLLQKVNNE